MSMRSGTRFGMFQAKCTVENTVVRESARRRSRSFLGCILGACLLAPSLAFAQIELECLDLPLPAGCVSYEFEFEAEGVIDPIGLFGVIGFGDVISGSITLNTNIDDLLPADPDTGAYSGAVECARILLDGAELVFVQEPFVPNISDPLDDVGYKVFNDMIDPEAPISPEVDVVSGSIAGLGLLGPVGGSSSLGAGGFAFAYGEGCLDVPFSPFPCPPMLLDGDAIPDAPGDVSVLQASPVELIFEQVEGVIAVARVDGRLLSLNPADDIPCPEPGFGLALAIGAGCIACVDRRAGRKRRSA